MNDTVEKTSSSLAVVEKKAQRPGGCVGIFFQLFDWNRRFAKKKLFSKKLLPPVRSKHASKKFGGDEKQAKLRLIADENSGGFPSAKSSNGSANVDNEQRHETRVPGLVARLMGLESMPAFHREKSKKLPQSGSVSGKAEKFVDNREELNVEKGGGVRPQKLQKTSSVFERQPMAKFGAEKLPLKSVLSKSRKHHAKLPSPVKSPRNVSRKRSSKLIGAATRILEPGLQTSRSKCALTYSNSFPCPPRETHISTPLEEDSDGYGNVAENGDSSCRNCGYLLHNLNYVEEELHEDYQSVAGPIMGDAQPRLKNPYTGKPPPKGVQISPYRQNQMLWERERVNPRPKINSVAIRKVSTSVVNGRKNFVSVNEGSSCSTRLRVPARMDSGRFEFDRRITNHSVPPGRKRRPTNISRQGENSCFMSSTINKQSFGSTPARLTNHQPGRVGLVQRQDRAFNSGWGDSDAVSFKFNSPVKHKTGIDELAERRVRSGLCCDGSLEKSALGGENSRKTGFEKACRISGDALGALLEQKLNELNRQGEDNIGNAPKKTTAKILQELITALTLEVPFQLDNFPPITDRRNGCCHQSCSSNSTSFIHPQANAMGMKLSVNQPYDSEYLSPGSVLETGFSTESCPSSSVDESLGHKMLNECSCYETQTRNPDSELPFDFAASLDRVESSKDLVIRILNNISEILCCRSLAFGFKGDKLDQAKEVILNAELVFHTAMLSGSVVGQGSPIKHLFLDSLEMLASILWMKFGSSLGIDDGREEVNQLKTFALDSIIEYLALKFQGYPNCGSKVSTKLPLRLNNNMLILDIVRLVGTWEESSRLGLDELIEREMGQSLGEWTECETEAFETGMEISRHLFNILVDEIVIDLLKI